MVITVEKGKTKKIALHSRKLNNSCIEKPQQKSNVEDLISSFSSETLEDEKNALWISIVGLQCAYGYVEVDEVRNKTAG